MVERGEIPVIDLFAGPGGLCEGFSSILDEKGLSRFAVRVSIEKDPVAHRTLLLRALFAERAVAAKAVAERKKSEQPCGRWIASLGDVGSPPEWAEIPLEAYEDDLRRR